MTMPNQGLRGTWTPGHDISPQQTEFATERRVPFLSSPYPSRRYISGIVICNFPWQGIVPTEDEVEMVAGVTTSYLDFFFPKPNSFRQEMEEFAPYDIDPGATSFYFIKRPNGSWAYRRYTWAGSYTFRPHSAEAPQTLEEVVDFGSLRWTRAIDAL